MRKIPSILAVIFLALFLLPQAGLAIGITPASFSVVNMLPNSVVKKTVYVSRSNVDKDETAKVVIGGSAANYIKLSKGDTVALPKGMHNTPFEFSIEPGNLAKGSYKATLLVTPGPDPNNQKAGGQSILLGAQAHISFSVSNDAVEKYDIDRIAVEPVEENQKLSISYLLNNTGNVDVQPTTIKVVVTNANDSTDSHDESIVGSTLEPVPAFSQKQVTIPLEKTVLRVGAHKAEITFYKHSEVLTKKEIQFQVYAAGTLAQKLTIVSVVADKDHYDVGEIVKLDAAIKNDGQVGAQTALTVEIYNGSKRIDVVKGDQIFIPRGQKAETSVTFRATDSGNYTTKTYVTFGVLRSDTMTAGFMVGSVNNIWLIVTMSVLVLLFIAATILILRFMHRRRNDSSDATPTIPQPPVAPLQPPVLPPQPPVLPPQPPVLTPQPPTPQPPTPQPPTQDGGGVGMIQ